MFNPCDCSTCVDLFKKCDCDECVSKNKMKFEKCNCIECTYKQSESVLFQPCQCIVCRPDKNVVFNNYLEDTGHSVVNVVGKNNSLDHKTNGSDRFVNSQTSAAIAGDVLIGGSRPARRSGDASQVGSVSELQGGSVGAAHSNADSVEQAGGFRVLKDGQCTWVENVVDGKIDVGFSELEQFYFNAHSRIIESGVPNYRGEKIELPSHLNTQIWEEKLMGYEDKEVVDFLKYGFPVGYSRSMLPVSEIKNHSGANLYPDYIDNYVRKEVDEGLMLGPLYSNPLQVPISISPLNSVPKKSPGDRRIIADFSYPPGVSVNDGISKEFYLGESVELTYPSVDSLASLLKIHGPGVHIFKKDLRKAYRQFKIDPKDISLCGYVWDQAIYLDVALVMGARSAAYLCQRVTNSVQFMLKNKGIEAINYLDDICCISEPEVSGKKFREVTELFEDLGLKESVEKSVEPGVRVEFLGVMFDTENQTMEVTEERLVEIKALISLWQSKKKGSKKELQSLIGKLVFVTKCVLGSRIFISRLLATLRTLKKQHHRFKIGSEFRKDLGWWQQFLEKYNGVTYIPDMVWAEPDMNMSTDACLKGAGGFAGLSYFSEQFPEFVKKQNFHINILELLTVLVGLRLWGNQFSGLRIQIFCDNEASVQVINSGKSRDKEMLKILREIAFICASNNFQIKAIHLPGIANRTADILSRAPVDPGVNLDSLIDNSWNRVMVQENVFEVLDRW